MVNIMDKLKNISVTLSDDTDEYYLMIESKTSHEHTEDSIRRVAKEATDEYIKMLKDNGVI